MKHTEKLNMQLQDSASFVIALVIMAGTYVRSALKIPLVITLKSLAIVLRFNHEQQTL